MQKSIEIFYVSVESSILFSLLAYSNQALKKKCQKRIHALERVWSSVILHLFMRKNFRKWIGKNLA